MTPNFKKKTHSPVDREWRWKEFRSICWTTKYYAIELSIQLLEILNFHSRWLILSMRKVLQKWNVNWALKNFKRIQYLLKEKRTCAFSSFLHSIESTPWEITAAALFCNKYIMSTWYFPYFNNWGKLLGESLWSHMHATFWKSCYGAKEMVLWICMS